MKKKQDQDNNAGSWTPSVPVSKTAKIGVWMPLMIGDVRRDTLGMPAEFTGMYVNLMMAMWQNNGQLNDDEAYLCRISGASHEQWMRHRQDIANLFFPGDGSWNHNGIREALKKAGKISESRKAAGTTAINARWAKEREAKALAKTLMEKIAQEGGSY